MHPVGSEPDRADPSRSSSQVTTAPTGVGPLGSAHTHEKGMNGSDRRTFEMVGRTVNFNDARPDTDDGQLVSAGKLKVVRDRMEKLAAEQRMGLIAVHAASVEKRRIKQETLATPIIHVAEVGRLAAQDHPELTGLFRFKPSKDTLSAFRTAARTMLDAAVEHQELLKPYGLSGAVVELFGQLLDQFEAMTKQGTDGRGQHAGATRELKALAKEARGIVRAMDARNRHRFKDDQQALGAWLAASRVAAARATESEPDEGPVAGPTPDASGEQHAGSPGAGGDVRPAA